MNLPVPYYNPISKTKIPAVILAPLQLQLRALAQLVALKNLLAVLAVALQNLKLLLPYL